MDAWRVSYEDRMKNDQQFFALKPVNGFITGEQARVFFLQFGLPSSLLAQIWNLSDLNKDGKLDKKEFSVAMHLINKIVQGYPLPATLPDVIKEDPQPPYVAPGGFSVPPPQTAFPVAAAPMPGPPLAFGGGGMPLGSMPPIITAQPSISPMVGPAAAAGFISPPGGAVASLQSMPPARPDWSITAPAKQKYSQMFSNIDKNRTCFIIGTQARNILGQSGLPTNVLAQIWALSDVDKDGRLSLDEYCLAMHFIDQVKLGQVLPTSLPAELQHLGHARQRSVSVSGNKPSIEQELMDENGKPRFAATFEDRRKENFDRGQAELERRRQILLEQEKREREERDRKEREEFERKERERLEVEKRRQLELEKQMAKQREEQQKREEEYRKVIEQREAARRELEKQRQIEMERHRLHELMVQRQNEQETLCHVKQKQKNLHFQLQALNEKSAELDNSITEVREQIVAVTSGIEDMKCERDTKLLDMESCKRQMQELHVQNAQLQMDRKLLEEKRFQTSGENANAISDSYRQVMHAFRNKTLNVDSLRKSLSEIERDVEQHRHAEKDRLRLAKDAEERLQMEVEETKALLEKIVACQNELLKLKPNVVTQAKQQAWPPAFDDSPWPAPDSDHSGAAGPAATTNGESSATVKYKALYEFAARSTDELSFQPGDIILVFKDHVGEPGWLAGQIKDKVGWFPEAFAEPMDAFSSVTTNGTGGANSIVDPFADSSQAVLQKLESINEETGEKDEPIPPLTSPTRSLPKTIPNKNGAAVPQKAVAQFQWKAKKDNHLSFGKGDVIQVLEQQEMWWMGELDGKTGWFPKSYVRLIDADERRKSETAAAAAAPSGSSGVKSLARKFESQEFPSQADSSIGSSATSDAAAGWWYVAVYPFPEMEPGDLQFDAGQRILVVKRDGEWWTGRCNGREGMFPANYVLEASTAAELADGSKPPDVPEYATINKKAAAQKSFSTEKTPSIELSSTASADSGVEMAKVIAPFEATGANQLSLNTGDMIKIRSKSPTGWWEGELSDQQQKGRTGGKQIGWFPGNYVTILPTKPESSKTLKSVGSVDSTKSDGTTTAGGKPLRDTVMAMFDYVAQQDDELPLNRGDILVVLEKIDADWWKGETASGQQGLFPASYVQSYAGVDRRKISREKSSSHGPSASETISIGSKDNDDSSSPAVPVESCTTVQSPESNKISKRTMYCQELVYTEQNYLDDLYMIREVFYKQFLESKLLTGEEMKILFINWDELIRVAKAFLKTLKQYGDDRTGKAVLESAQLLRSAFVAFCRDQRSSLEFLDSKPKSCKQFHKLHLECSQHPAARGLPLNHFLLIPMTRVTKYPLIVKEILKYTPDDHADSANLREAANSLKQLCDEVNRSASETENLHMLYWCQNHVKCESIQPKFIFHSETNFMGPRKFLHFGILYKAKSNRLLIGLLFNDILMLTTPDETIDQPDAFKLTRNTEIILSLYKSPVLLHKAGLHTSHGATTTASSGGSEPTTTDETAFSVNSGETIIAFRAVSSNARLLWTKQIEKAIKSAREKFAQVQTTAAAFSTVVSSTAPQKSAAKSSTSALGRLLMEVVVLRNLNIPPDCKHCPVLLELNFGQANFSKQVDLERDDGAPLCTTQFVIESMSNVFQLNVYLELRYAPNVFLGKAALPINEMVKMSGSQKNPAIKQIPILGGEGTTVMNNESAVSQVIIKFVVQLFDNA